MSCKSTYRLKSGLSFKRKNLPNTSRKLSVVLGSFTPFTQSAKRRAHSVLLPSSHSLCAMLYALCVYGDEQPPYGQNSLAYCTKLTVPLRLSHFSTHPFHNPYPGCFMNCCSKFTNIGVPHAAKALVPCAWSFTLIVLEDWLEIST